MPVWKRRSKRKRSVCTNRSTRSKLHGSRGSCLRCRESRLGATVVATGKGSNGAQTYGQKTGQLQKCSARAVKRLHNAEHGQVCGGGGGGGRGCRTGALSIPVPTQSDFAVFPHEKVCQPSSLQSKLHSMKTRLNWLQTVIDGQENRRTLDEMSKSQRSRLDTSFCTRRSGSSQVASDKTVSGTACTGTELHCKPTRSVDQLREVCPSSTLHSSTHCSGASISRVW